LQKKSFLKSYIYFNGLISVKKVIFLINYSFIKRPLSKKNSYETYFKVRTLLLLDLQKALALKNKERKRYET